MQALTSAPNELPRSSTTRTIPSAASRQASFSSGVRGFIKAFEGGPPASASASAPSGVPGGVGASSLTSLSARCLRLTPIPSRKTSESFRPTVTSVPAPWLGEEEREAWKAASPARSGYGSPFLRGPDLATMRISIFPQPPPAANLLPPASCFRLR